tara:strand:- start:348 stop:797 length:450 start_codon:yes stop_codon:yes gene_type:complete
MMLDSTDTKVRYLLELGTDKISHSGSTLIKHLVGVHDILVANGAPRYVCDAGLFHSIYGTPAFTHQSTDDRNAVRDLIGTAAERLVYEFSILGRPRTHHIGELADGQLREDLTMLNGANQMEMNRRPAKEMELEEAYEGMWNYNGGRRA